MADDEDVKPEITIEDFNADEQQPAKAEPSPAPDKKEKAEVKGKDSKGDDTPELPDIPTKTEPDEAKDKAEVKPEAESEKPEVEVEDKPTKAEDRKAQLNSEIRDLVSQRNQLRQEVEKTNAEVYQPATEEELSDQGMTAIEAKVEAMRQEREMEKFNNQVAEAQLTIGSESQRVLTDFPMFNPDSDQYDKELAEAAADHVASMLIIDPNTNQVIGANGSVYNYYQTLNRATGISATKGEIKGQQNTEKQLANVDANSGTAPETKPKDPLMELWSTDD